MGLYADVEREKEIEPLQESSYGKVMLSFQLSEILGSPKVKLVEICLK